MTIAGRVQFQAEISKESEARLPPDGPMIDGQLADFISNTGRLKSLGVECGDRVVLVEVPTAPRLPWRSGAISVTLEAHSGRREEHNVTRL
jgi:hypothetical protein